MDIAELLTFSVTNKASDLHLSSGLPPMIRVDGDIRRINVPALDHKEVHALIYMTVNKSQVSRSHRPRWKCILSCFSRLDAFPRRSMETGMG